MRDSEPAFRIDSPCPRRWAELEGSGPRRYCDSCRLQVHNVSAMSRTERADFHRRLEGPVCIAYEVRPDGAMAQPPRFPRLRKWLRLAAALVPFLGSSCATPAPMATGGMLPPRRNDLKVKSARSAGTEESCAPKSPGLPP